MIKQLKGAVTGALLGGALVTAQASSFVVGVWDFNVNDSDASTGTLLNTDGGGQLDPLGNGSFDFASGSGSSDVGPDNSALRLTMPAGSQTADLTGADFGISTLGFNNIQIAFDFRHPAGSALPFHFEYSTSDGGFWTRAKMLATTGGGSWSNGNLVDLSADVNSGNNSNLRFRLIGELDSPLGADEALLELDRVQITGTPSAVPEPTAVVMGVGLALLAAGRRWVRR